MMSATSSYGATTQRGALNKQSSHSSETPKQVDAAIRQLVSRAITTEGQVIDVFTAARLPQSDISVLTDDEVAFYDALAANQSAELAMGDDKPKLIAAELITQVRKSVSIDWTLCEGAQAELLSAGWASGDFDDTQIGKNRGV